MTSIAGVTCIEVQDVYRKKRKNLFSVFYLELNGGRGILINTENFHSVQNVFNSFWKSKVFFFALFYKCNKFIFIRFHS